jgi:hypothetical protein
MFRDKTDVAERYQCKDQSKLGGNHDKRIKKSGQYSESASSTVHICPDGADGNRPGGIAL